MYKLGLNMKLFYKIGGVGGAGTYVELTNVRDLTLTLESDRADLTVRGSGGWRQEVPTLTTGAIEFSMVWDTEDAGFEAMKDAFLSKGIIGIQCLDGAVADTPPGQGLESDMGVFSFTRNEELAEGVTVDVSLGIAYGAAPEWIPAGALMMRDGTPQRRGNVPRTPQSGAAPATAAA